MNRPVAELKSALLDVLRVQCRGRANALRLDDIGAGLGLSWRETAALIEALRWDGELIGTSRSKDCPGAFWPVTTEDFEAALEPYARAFHRMSEIYNRMKRGIARELVERVERRVQASLFTTESTEDTENNNGQARVTASSAAP